MNKRCFGEKAEEVDILESERGNWKGETRGKGGASMWAEPWPGRVWKARGEGSWLFQLPPPPSKAAWTTCHIGFWNKFNRKN